MGTSDHRNGQLASRSGLKDFTGDSKNAVCVLTTVGLTSALGEPIGVTA